MPNIQRTRKDTIIWALISGALLAGLYITSFENYLLFHSLAEIFSIVIACGLFMIAWNARGLMEDNPFFVHLGIAYLFIAFLDLMHTLSYKGMGIFTDYDFYANQLWIATRYLESLTLLGFTVFIGNSRYRNYMLTFVIYFIITAAILISVFGIKVFPVCFVEGKGLTPFKIISEYVISGILLAALLLFRRRRKIFDRQIFRLLFWSIIATIGSEIAFTFYIDNYGFSNMVGHYLKILSFYLIYHSLVREGIRNPMRLYFSRLETTARDLQVANETKNRLLSIIAHDLKNSFNSTIGLTELMLTQETIPTDNDTGNTGLIRMINSSAKATHGLLENLLAWAENESGRLQVRRKLFNMTRTCRSVHSYSVAAARMKDIALVCDVPQEEIHVLADENMLQSVLRNLVNNALKYTPRDGTVTLRLRRDGEAALLEVEDTGVGLDGEAQRKILEGRGQFTRRGTDNERGTGLGLHLVTDFLKKNGSALEIQSAPGRGSCFSFRLDISPPKP